MYGGNLCLLFIVDYYWYAWQKLFPTYNFPIFKFIKILFVKYKTLQPPYIHKVHVFTMIEKKWPTIKKNVQILAPQLKNSNGTIKLVINNLRFMECYKNNCIQIIKVNENF